MWVIGVIISLSSKVLMTGAQRNASQSGGHTPVMLVTRELPNPDGLPDAELPAT